MKRILLLTAVAAMTTATLAGCSKGNTTTQGNQAQGTSAPTSSEAVSPTTKKSGGDSSDTTSKKTTGSTGTSGKTTTTKAGGSASSTIPGIPPGADTFPAVPKDIQKCVDISTAYLALFAPFASGNYDQKGLDDAVATLEKIKGEVPSNVADALQVLEDGIKNIKSQGDMVTFFTSDEFEKNNEIVTNYVTVQCQTQG